MARKSRKNMMPQAAVQEAVQQNEKELLRTAAYARLSVENGGHETEDSLHELIKRIYVGMDNSVEVEFKCSDPYQEVLAIMSEVQNE